MSSQPRGNIRSTQQSAGTVRSDLLSPTSGMTKRNKSWKVIEDCDDAEKCFNRARRTSEGKLHSQEDNDEAIQFANGKKRNKVEKDKKRLTEEYLLKLYNDVNSQMHFGFSYEMKNIMIQSSLMDVKVVNDYIMTNIYPPPEAFYDKMDRYLFIAAPIDKRELQDLKIEKNKFPPTLEGSSNPPTLREWKQTKVGRKYFDVAQNGDNEWDKVPSALLSIMENWKSTPCRRVQENSLIGGTTIQTGNSTPNQGIIDIDICGMGKSVIFGRDMEVTSNSTMFAAISTITGFRFQRYDPTHQQRVFKIKNTNGDCFSFTKNQMKNITVANMLSFANIQVGQGNLTVISEVEEKVDYTDNALSD